MKLINPLPANVENMVSTE